MQRSKVFLSALLVMAVMSQASLLMAQEREVNWKAFSVNLTKAIKSDNPGLQQSAMQRIIRYADKLEVDAAVYDITNIFRFDKNPRVRRLAMVTLSSINSDKSMEYLSKYIKFEEDKAILKQACCIMALHESLKTVGKEEYVAEVEVDVDENEDTNDR